MFSFQAHANQSDLCDHCIVHCMHFVNVKIHHAVGKTLYKEFILKNQWHRDYPSFAWMKFLMRGLRDGTSESCKLFMI